MLLRNMRRLLGGLLLIFLALALLAAVKDHRLSGEDQPVSALPGTEAREAPGYGVRGRVTSVEGAPIAGGIVQAESLDEPKQAIPDLGVMTGEDGGYWWPFKPGRYRLSITAKGYQTVSQNVVVRPNELARLDFSLKEAAP
jgi:hypothetical protein